MLDIIIAIIIILISFLIILWPIIKELKL